MDNTRENAWGGKLYPHNSKPQCWILDTLKNSISVFSREGKVQLDLNINVSNCMLRESGGLKESWVLREWYGFYYWGYAYHGYLVTLIVSFFPSVSQGNTCVSFLVFHSFLVFRYHLVTAVYIPLCHVIHVYVKSSLISVTAKSALIFKSRKHLSLDEKRCFL